MCIFECKAIFDITSTRERNAIQRQFIILSAITVINCKFPRVN